MRQKAHSRFDSDDLSLSESLVIACGFFVVCGVSLAFGHDAYVKFGGLALCSSILFGYFLHLSREFLRDPKFWMLAASLMLVHLGAWIALLLHVERWGLLWFNIMIIELPVFLYFRTRLIGFD
jgi:hypothetical protein